ncbi:cytochrome P450 monooxygenase [Penicillium sp. IBT 16267x]|nr:cytochrome P450 monooxygenase [Penicillium sp. IBT 16267x]
MSVLLDAKSCLATAVSTAIIYLFTKVIYNVYFHPLSRFPGPKSHAISRIPYFRRAINGTLPFDMLDLHKRYGDIVRIAPDELAFSHPDAWKDIMGHKNGEPEMAKANWFYRPLDEPLHIVNEDIDEHKRLRRQMAHAFSEKSMREQEPMIRKYVDILLERLRENCTNGSVVISDWYNFTTFDIIGDLAFGESFGCLEGCKYDEWIKGIFEGAHLGSVLQALSCFVKFAITEERPDLIEGLLKKKDELNLGVEKLVANAEILIIGDSEKTASLLSGVTYLLLQNPEAHQILKDEVRSTFRSEEEINLISVNQLSYMLACLDEAMRMYPPIANGLPRVCPKGGSRVLGEYIPESTNLSIHQWALYRREEYFKDPNSFHPERFLGLAYSEMRLILALIIFNFDMKIADESRDWIKQRNFLMWEKGPLKVYLTPRTNEFS